MSHVLPVQIIQGTGGHLCLTDMQDSKSGFGSELPSDTVDKTIEGNKNPQRGHLFIVSLLKFIQLQIA